MLGHQFIFQSGVWLGQGEISFSASKEQIPCSTKWTVEEKLSETGERVIFCLQEVEIRDSGDKLNNRITLSAIQPPNFLVELTNENIDKIAGKGVVSSTTIAWELRDKEGYEGFEVYEKQDNEEYNFHAEYASSENFRTIVDGKIWKKAFPPEEGKA
ncbi:MAG: hypothetical protein ACSNEK_02945 [Parachlamydiaceae bacterium]